ncbi:MAG: alpha-1,2-fucosyltransferase, partial [Romboutsia sp.]|nr:alpha-1,2-fucosyltransferase [Romboutsia sp.]
MTGKIYVLTRGGFGNIIFNYLIGYSLAKTHGMELYLIPDNHGNRPPINRYQIFNTLNMISQKDPQCITINEKEYVYKPVIIEDTEKSYLLNGYYQSYKYSENYLQEIKKELFNNIPELYEQTRQMMTTIKGNRTAILLHVRRGDYLRLPNYHPTQPDKYYDNALEIIFKKLEITMEEKDKYIIMCFSDDIKFLQNWSLLKKYNHYIVQESDILKTFLLMVLCYHYVICNFCYSFFFFYF